MNRFIINTADIIHNYNEISKLTNALVIPTLKADCYGLGAKRVFELLHDECGVSLFAVSRLEEALPLSQKGAEILLLSCYHDMPSIKAAVDAGVTLAVDSYTQCERIAKYALEAGKVAKVQVKIDTGFGRFGFMPTAISDIEKVYNTDGINVTGIFSHFSNAFNEKADTTDRQAEIFSGVITALTERGIKVGLRHIANSCGAVRGPKYRFDAVRIGSALCGRLPMKTNLELKRVGRFETEIIDIRRLKKGTNIGYGNVYRLKRDTRVAVICAGTADGVLIKKDYDTFRVLDILRYGFNIFKMLFRDNRLTVTVNGKTVRTVGRVALTHTMIDVTDIDCKSGDKAVINISPLYVPSNVEREYI